MDTPAVPTTKKESNKQSKVLFIALMIVLGIFIGRYIIPATQANPVVEKFVSVKDNQRSLVFPTFWEAWDELHASFNGSLDDKELFYGAIEGMVRASGDPYTAFMDPDATKEFEQSLNGVFSGVGIEIGLKKGLITVISPLNGSPAKEAGVKEGDVIIAVDKNPITQDTTIDEVVNKIRGPKGEEVVLTLINEKDNASRDIPIIRDTIEIESAKYSIENNIATIEITNFNIDTSERVAKAVKEISRQNVKGIVLDLRGNPGGYLQAAVDITANFVSSNSLVVSEKGKENKEYKTRGGGALKDLPIVVLVDGGSASASEILAGALLDIRNVPIVGQKTFGKGSVQELIDLKDGSSMRITIAKWYTPNGTSIQEQGIEPTVSVENNPDTEDIDEQMDRALEELQKIINK